MAALARVGPYGADRQPDGPARAAPEVDVVAILNVLAHVRREQRRRAAAGRCCCWPLLLASPPGPHEQQHQALHGRGCRAHGSGLWLSPDTLRRSAQLLAGGSTRGRGEVRSDVARGQMSEEWMGFTTAVHVAGRLM